MRRWVILFLAAPAAWAQLGEISVSVGRSNMRNNVLGSLQVQLGQTVEYKADTDFRLGFALTFNNEAFFGHEIGYAYNRGSFKQGDVKLFGLPVHQAGYNFLLYATPEGSPIRPFATGGGHFSTFYPPGTGVFSGNGVTKFGFNYGGGLKVRVSPIFLVRFDVRNYSTGKPFGDSFPDQKGLLHQLAITAGLAFAF